MNVREKLQVALDSVKSQVDLKSLKPLIGVVLGSGLGDLADEIADPQYLPYESIEGFPVSTVAGHQGRFVFGKLRNVPVIAMQGRVHYYEGYSMQDVVLPTRLMGLMGVKAILLTNASGGFGEGFKAGDFMLIKDHIMQFVPSPLIGANLDDLGTRFPDMTKVYDEDLSDAIREASREEEILLHEGVYCQLTGPQFETPAEIQMLRAIGGSTAGMSTAVEAVAARHMGVRVAGISCISNLAAGITGEPLTHEEVNEVTQRVSRHFSALVGSSLVKMAELL